MCVCVCWCVQYFFGSSDYAGNGAAVCAAGLIVKKVVGFYSPLCAVRIDRLMNQLMVQSVLHER